MAADFAAGADCNSVVDAPGVGRGRDELVAAIRARPSVVSTPPTEVTVGGFSGLMLDLRLAPSWTGRLHVAAEARVIGASILHGAGRPVPSSASARTLRCDSSSSTWATATRWRS